MTDHQESHNPPRDPEPGIDPEALAAIKEHPMDRAVVQLRTYEPDGGTVTISGRDLCQHTLVIGSTGSGKTTGVMFPILRDLIHHRADEPEHRFGLLIYDSKEDDTLGMVERYAAEAGRTGDVHVLGPGGTHALDFFSDGIDERTINLIVEQMSAIAPEEGSNVQFFNFHRRTLLQAAIFQWWLTSPSPTFSSMINSINEILLGANSSLAIRSVTTKLEAIGHKLPQSVQNLLKTTISTLHGWTNLDHRTKSNTSATLSNAITPLTGYLASSFFVETPERPMLKLDALNQGAIIVIRLPTLRDALLSKIIAGLIKGLCLQVGLKRPEQIHGTQRFIGMILDEYPLVATGKHPVFGDLVLLQTLRSRGIFVAAATQGLINLNLVVGSECLGGLLNNFGNLIFMKSPERESEAWAQLLLGTHLVRKQAPPAFHPAFQPGSEEPRFVNAEVPVVKHGSLSALNTHQAFIRIYSGFRTLEPVWLVPEFAPVGLTSNTLRDDDSVSGFELAREIAQQAWAPQVPGTSHTNGGGASPNFMTDSTDPFSGSEEEEPEEWPPMEKVVVDNEENFPFGHPFDDPFSRRELNDDDYPPPPRNPAHREVPRENSKPGSNSSEK